MTEKGYFEILNIEKLNAKFRFFEITISGKFENIFLENYQK